MTTRTTTEPTGRTKHSHKKGIKPEHVTDENQSQKKGGERLHVSGEMTLGKVRSQDLTVG